MRSSTLSSVGKPVPAELKALGNESAQFDFVERWEDGCLRSQSSKSAESELGAGKTVGPFLN